MLRADELRERANVATRGDAIDDGRPVRGLEQREGGEKLEREWRAELADDQRRMQRRDSTAGRPLRQTSCRNASVSAIAGTVSLVVPVVRPTDVKSTCRRTAAYGTGRAIAVTRARLTVT